MEALELKAELETMAKNLEGKSSIEIKNALEAFETKHNDAIELAVKEVKEALELDMKAIQDHADKLDIKLQEKEVKEASQGDVLRKAITANFDEIKGVKKGNSIEVKAVGDMGTGNLTGDEPRDYNFDVVMFPNQKVNVSDLVGNVQISGGTYTFTREVTGEGSISTQTEGSSKSQIDYDFLNVDVATDFLAGFARYSKKMKNNLPYLESFIPKVLRRDYAKAENAAFNTILIAQATASTQIITGKNKIEMLINDVARLDGLDRDVNAIAVTPADYWDILITEKSTGAGYGLPGIVSLDGGVLRINGIPLVKATWMTANKYFVADWSRINKVTTEGLSLDFSEEEGTNFVKNQITARIEAQVALAVEDKLAILYGDFTAV
jgi:HK97 family phage major capsid protein